jgi:hypothetical protein
MNIFIIINNASEVTGSIQSTQSDLATFNMNRNHFDSLFNYFIHAFL